MEAQSGPLVEATQWFLDHLRVEKGASEHTIAAYNNDLRIAASYFDGLGITKWADLNDPYVAQYESSLGVGISQSTAQRRLSSLRSFLKYLKRRGVGPQADLPSTGGFKKKKALPKALDITQMIQMLEAPDVAKPGGLRDRTLMELIYGAGLRVSEAVGLKMEEIDLDNGALRVTGKRGKTRWIPLPKATLGWVRVYLLTSGELQVVEAYRRDRDRIRLEAGGELDALRPGVVEPAKVRQRVPCVVRDDRRDERLPYARGPEAVASGAVGARVRLRGQRDLNDCVRVGSICESERRE